MTNTSTARPSPAQLAEWVARPAALRRLPQSPEVLAALPVVLRPHHVRWLLGAGERGLRILRSEHPEWVIDGRRGRPTTYSRDALFRYAKISVQFPSPLTQFSQN